MLGQVASSALAFAFSLLVSHLYGAAGTGLFYEALALLLIASTISNLGADTGLTWAISHYRAVGRPDDVRRVLPIAIAPALLAGSALAVVLVVAAPDLARLTVHGHGVGYHTKLGSGAHYIRILAAFVPIFSLTALLYAATRGFGAIWPLVGVQNIAVPVGRIVVLMALLALGVGATAVPLAWGLPLVVSAAAGAGLLARMLIAQEHALGHRAHVGRTAAALAKEFWSFAIQRGFAATFAIITLWLDVVLVGAIVSTRQAGIYSVASRYVGIPTYAVGALGIAFMPQMSRLFSSGRREDAGSVYQIGTAWLVAVSWPLCFLMILFAPVLMRFFGPEFATGASALVILAGAMLVQIATGNNFMVLIMSGGSSVALALTASGAVLNVGLNLWLIPRWGINGAATAWAVTMVGANLGAAVVLAHRQFIHPLSRRLAAVVAATAICFGAAGGIVRLLIGETPAGLAIAAAVGGILYAAVLWQLRDTLDLRSFRPASRTPQNDLATVGAAGERR